MKVCSYCFRKFNTNDELIAHFVAKHPKGKINGVSVAKSLTKSSKANKKLAAEGKLTSVQRKWKKENQIPEKYMKLNPTKGVIVNDNTNN